MVDRKLLSDLVSKGYQGALKENYSIAKYTTFKMGGNAQFFAEPRTKEDIAILVRVANEQRYKVRVIGRGSNLLVTNGKVKGIVLHLDRNFAYLSEDAGLITVGAGASFPKLVRFASKLNLGGIDFGFGIPGSVGGSIYMNAGMGSGLGIGDFVEELTAIDVFGSQVTITKNQLQFSYRKSNLQSLGVLVIIQAKLKLQHLQREDINRNIAKLMTYRAETQPLDKRSFGSIFKRGEGYTPGEVVESLGYKGSRLGGVEISRKHANFMINNGKANYKDAIAMLENIKNKAMMVRGIMLESEVECWDD